MNVVKRQDMFSSTFFGLFIAHIVACMLKPTDPRETKERVRSTKICFLPPEKNLIWRSFPFLNSGFLFHCGLGRGFVDKRWTRNSANALIVEMGKPLNLLGILLCKQCWLGKATIWLYHRSDWGVNGQKFLRKWSEEWCRRKHGEWVCEEIERMTKWEMGTCSLCNICFRSWVGSAGHACISTHS